ncbi:MAG: hypothetical protein CML96_00675 [Rhodobiaceae bacterium]|nr:hypothetical protein [Rhodobiaceae bacterium]|tara:strand:+ start:3542 stop:3979 length:438 start_codon:yes stop_codon:yes gene_type:complete
MKNILTRIFGKKIKDEKEKSHSEADFAVLVILIRAAIIDGSKEEVEITTIKKIALENLKIDDNEIDELIRKAIKAEEDSTDLFKWTKIINENFEEQKKLELFSMVCQTIVSDGTIDPFESNLIRRLSGLLYITDKMAGEILKKYR